jgi:hypothetical protein
MESSRNAGGASQRSKLLLCGARAVRREDRAETSLAELFTELQKFREQPSQPSILRDMSTRELDGAAGWHEARDRPTAERARERPRGPVAATAFAHAVATRLSAPSVPLHERTGTEIPEPPDLATDLVEALLERRDV